MNRYRGATYCCIALSGCALMSCGGPADQQDVAGEDPTASVESPIYAGNLEPGYPAVGRVVGGGHQCTATLIGPTTVLTAAHCLDPVPGQRFLPARFETGPNVSSPTATSAVAEVYAHPSYTWGDTDDYNQWDLAVLKLGDTNMVGTVPMTLDPWSGHAFAHTGDGIIIGYGARTQKKSAAVWMTSNGGYYEVQTGSGHNEGGDSGGPLIWKGFNYVNPPKEIGVCSGESWDIFGNFSKGYYNPVQTQWVDNLRQEWDPEPLVAASSGHANRIDMFGRGYNGELQFRAWDSTSWYPQITGQWYNLDAGAGAGPGPLPAGAFPMVGSPEVVAAGTTNQLHVFVRGQNLTVYHASYDGVSPKWTPWESLGTTKMKSHISATSGWPGQIDIAAVGIDGHVYHKSFVNYPYNHWWPSQTEWEDLKGSALNSVKIVAPKAGYLSVFVVQSDRKLYLRAFNPATTGWNPPTTADWKLVAGTESGVKGVIGATGFNDDTQTVQVWGHLNDNRLFMAEYLDTTLKYPSSGVMFHGFKSADGPAVVSSGTNVVDVFAQGLDHAVYYISCTRSPRNCTAQKKISGAGVTGSPTVTSWGPGRLDLFVTGFYSEVQHFWRSSATAAWGGPDLGHYCGIGSVCPSADPRYAPISGYMTR
jgi:hypothetical protein